GFEETTEGPVFDLGVSPDDAEAQPGRRPVFDLSDESPGGFSVTPGGAGGPPAYAGGYEPATAGGPTPVQSEEESRQAEVTEATQEMTINLLPPRVHGTKAVGAAWATVAAILILELVGLSVWQSSLLAKERRMQQDMTAKEAEAQQVVAIGTEAQTVRQKVAP